MIAEQQATLGTEISPRDPIPWITFFVEKSPMTLR
jgi:hypothetical protein